MIRISVFGGSNLSLDHPDYSEALRLGILLGRHGCTVLTGGYIGSMEAVSRGVAETGGYVIGVTCDEIEAWRPVAPNPWVMEEIRIPTLRERIYTLISQSDAAIALPGGVGTLAEISAMWNHLLTQAIPARPLILVGKGWQSTVEAFLASQSEYIPASQRRYISFVDNIDEALMILGLNNKGA